MRRSRIKYTRAVGPVSSKKSKQKALKKTDRNTYRIARWSGALSGSPAFILGNGPSISDWDLDVLDGFLTIGINQIIDIYDPTILLWQDVLFWNNNHGAIMRSKAIKVARRYADPEKIACRFELVGKDPVLTENPTKLYGYGTSGILAVQLAYALGSRTIILLGCDCCHRGEKTDFYGVNPHHKAYSMRNCRKGLKWIKEVDYQGDINIVNCSDNKLWEKRDLNEVVREMEVYKTQSDYYKAKLLQTKYKK